MGYCKKRHRFEILNKQQNITNMKKQILIGLILLSSILTINAQTWTGCSDVNGNLWRNGNVGIGIDNPTVKLQVDGDISAAKKIGFNIQDAFDVSGNSVAHYGLSRISGTGYHNVALSGYYGLEFYTLGEQRIKVLGNGNVGIGTTAPKERLEILGNLFFRSASNTVNTSQGIIKFASPSYLSQWGGVEGRTITGAVDQIQLGFYTSGNSGVPTEKMTILADGNVGIGTTSPVYKLDIKGTIRACEVKVDLLNGCDFVFKNNYKLMDLKKLEEFVKVNQHLPEIASEKEMIENGVNMKELQMKLLQKMEEMTLYIIEQNKKLELQNEKIMTLEDEIKELKAK